MDHVKAKPHHSTNPDQEISDELRKKVYDMLADALIKGLELLNPDIFNVRDSENSAEFIIDHMKSIKTRGELLVFLKHLSDKWEVFRPVYLDFVPVHMVLNADDLKKAFSDSDLVKHADILVEWHSRKHDAPEHISLEEAMARLQQMSS